jgi:nicotinamidase-related amidase
MSATATETIAPESGDALIVVDRQNGLKEGFQVVLLAGAIRAVEAQPRDGDRAIAEMREAGALAV